METLALVPEPPSMPLELTRRPEAAQAEPRVHRQPARLQVALVADGPLQPRWLSDAFQQTALSAWAEVVLVLVGRAKPQRLPSGWRLYQGMERWWSGRFGSKDDPAAAEDIRSLGLRVVTLVEETDTAWGEEIRRVSPDVVFLLGSDEFVARRSADPAVTARFGSWRFDFGDWGSQVWAGVSETARGDVIETSRLVARLPDGEERVLTDSWTRTMQFSVGGNQRRLLQRTAEYPARALRGLAEQGAEWLHTRSAPKPAASSDTAAPALLPSLGRIAGRVATRGLQKLAYVDQWFLAYRFGDSEQRGWRQDWGGFTCLMPPRDRFWADPFPIKWGERYLVFFEELPFATQRAHISVMEVAPDGSCSEPRPVLARDYHLSYPFLFEAEGRLFMIPETGENRSVELYSCQRIPDQWRLEQVLLRDAYYVDASVHQADGRWWMFVNVGRDAANLHDELHLYYAEHFLGPWHAHSGNPVKSDVRSARSAGRLFEEEGRLYRPAQICAPLYGSGLSLNQVQTLSPDQYAEQEVGRILPPRNSRVLGVHTLNRAGRLTVIDGFIRRRRFAGDVLTAFEPERLLTGLEGGLGNGVGNEVRP